MELEAKIYLKSTTANVSSTRKQIEAFARCIGFSDEETNNIGLAVNEALANIIKHGYKGDPNQDIFIELRHILLPQEGIEIRICDNAQPVEPEDIKGRELEDIRPGGLGVYLIQSVVDYLEYKKRPCKGMEVIMIKYKNTQVR